MLHPGELRIGNICAWSTPNLPINITLMNHVVTADDIANYCKGKILLEPIPLTEELMDKCGFEWEAGNESINKLMGEGQDDERALSGDYYERGSIALRVISNTRNRLVLQFVPHQTILIESLHQLQNIYFALTGKELQFNQ